MEVFVIAFVGMLVLVAAMAVGVIFSNKPISGSCGGMSALGMDVACDVCKGDKTKCDKEIAKAEAVASNNNTEQELAYNAMGSGKD